MNTFLWTLQAYLAFLFLYSGVSKTLFSESKIVSMGMTGMEAMPMIITRFVGITEVLGGIGIILPLIINVYPFFVLLSALSFAVIMVPAAFIHYKRKEYKTILFNISTLIICIIVLWGRRELIYTICNM